MTEKIVSIKGPYFNVYRQNITTSYILMSWEIRGCNHISLLLLSDCVRAWQVKPFQGKLTGLSPSSPICRFLKEGDALVVFFQCLTHVFPLCQTAFLCSPFEPQVLLQHCTTVLGVCAVLRGVGKILSKFWSSSFSLWKWSHVASHFLLWISQT